MSGVLKVYQLQPQNNPVMMFVDGKYAGSYRLDAPYQRGSVWTFEQKQNLVKSLLQQVPLGCLYVNRRDFPSDPDAFVIDGKQRIEALRDFVNDVFWIPGKWLNKEDFAIAPIEQVYYSELSKNFKTGFGTSTIQVYWTDLPTEEEERDLYLRVNYGGTPH